MRFPFSKYQVLWLGVFIISAGCTVTPRIDIYALGYDSRPPRVDLVGVSGMKKMQWDQVTMNDYHKSGSEVFGPAQDYTKPILFYKDRVLTVEKNGRTARLYSLKRNDEPAWKNWEELGADYLYVFVLPFDTNRNPTALRVPLDYKNCWASDVFEIYVEDDKILAYDKQLKKKYRDQLRPSQ